MFRPQKMIISQIQTLVKAQVNIAYIYVFKKSIFDSDLWSVHGMVTDTKCEILLYSLCKKSRLNRSFTLKTLHNFVSPPPLQASWERGPHNRRVDEIQNFVSSRRWRRRQKRWHLFWPERRRDVTSVQTNYVVAIVHRRTGIEITEFILLSDSMIDTSDELQFSTKAYLIRNKN
jgi:hypothetical protein